MKILSSRENAKRNMYRAVIDCCDNYSSILVANVALNDSAQDFKAIIVRIDEGAQKTGAKTEGVTTDKKASKKSASRDAATMAGRVYAYAAKNGNGELKQAADFSESDLLRLKDSEFAPACQAICDLAGENKTALKDYGVTTEKLAALQAKIDAYAASAAKPRSAIANRSVAKANNKELFKKADGILTERMDKLVEDFAESNPVFVAEYKAARIIIDPKTGKKIKDAKTATPPA